MASSEDASQPSRSQWYVTDLSLSLQFNNHNLAAIISVLVFSFVVLLTLFFFHFIRQYRDLSAGSRSQYQFRVGGIALAAVATQNMAGLDEATINSLPTFLHTSTLMCSGSEISECSICLGMFEENDRVKVIPKCMHVYHLECLDKWLHSHGNCPLCRSTIDTFN